MIKNRMSLTKLLTIALLTIVFFTTCFGYGASIDMRHNDDSAQIFVMVFAAASILLLITSIGIWMRQNWARIFLIIILIVLMIAWAVLLWNWYQTIWVDLGKRQRFLPPLFSIFLYCILLGGIFFLNNSKVKEEFGKRLS